MLTLSYTYQGGPLDGIEVKKWRVDPAKLAAHPLTAETTLCRAGRLDAGGLVWAQGRYRIRGSADAGYTATHVPSADDCEFPPLPPAPATVALQPGTVTNVTLPPPAPEPAPE